MSKSRWSALGLVAVLAFAAASTATAGDGTGADGAKDGTKDGTKDGNRPARRAAMRERARQSVKHRRANSMKFLESLQATDEQRALVLEKAKAAAPILSEARRQARTLVAQAMASASKEPASKEPPSNQPSKADRKAAHNAARQSVKAQLQTIRDQTRGQIDALAKDVVASLTPEQRQKLQDVATKRGKTLDDARLTRLAAAMISRPMTAPYLEAKQAK